MNLSDALARTNPSINILAKTSGIAALTSAIQMRGLSPNEVLVLVDGKRRHTTANFANTSGTTFGSSPVDLNMIPSNAIDHIEVLEDGAAAMYGSDAIAGVVNIITKKTSHSLNMTGETGANAYNGDGWTYQLGADGGLKLGNDGFLHISGQVYHADHMIPDTRDHRLLGYWPHNAYTSGYYTGIVRNSLPIPENSNKITSTPEETRENLSIDWEKPISENATFYGLITYAHRHAESNQQYRIPTTASSLYPSGFLPIIASEENDYSATVGVKGRNLLGFDWDLSTIYGSDYVKMTNVNTANTGMLVSTCSTNSSSSYYSSIGCGFSPTKITTEAYRFGQWTNNLDLRRRFNLGSSIPLVLAFGGEHRLETYQIWPGETASYELGGAQGHSGLRPQSAGAWSRDVWAGYLDTDFHFLNKLELDFAGRFEHYTDSGNTENGKVSLRYNVSRRIALRATISNGFRAPTMAEQHYSNVTVSPTSASGLLAVSSVAAKNLGASPLKPERSVTATGGIVLEPIDRLHIEADAYQINIRDRIVQGGTTTGEGAVDAITNSGYSLPSTVTDISTVSAYYLANGASTRTQGIDIKTDYTLRLHRYGNLNLSLALNINRTTLHHNGLSSTGKQLLNAQQISYLTTANPRSKIILNAFYTTGAWSINIRQTRYGETTSMMTYQDWTDTTLKCPSGGSLRGSSRCFDQFKNTPRWLTDIEVGYQVNHTWHIAVGSNNVFNIRPRKLPDNLQAFGVIYDGNSAQVPINGGYYYGRVNAVF